MKKNRAQKDILYISISSFVLVALWVGFNLYHAYATSTITPDLELQIQPIDPTFNTQLIQKLKNRQKIAPVYELTNASAGAEITPSPTPVAAPSVNESLTPTSAVERLGQ